MTSDRRRWWALGVVSVSVFAIAADASILNVALPTLARELPASTSDLQWIVSSYSLVLAALLLVGGNLGDRFGRARVLQCGLIAFGAASALAAWSTSVTTLVVCRTVMGIGAALFLPASLSIVTNVFMDPRERGRAIGVWAAVIGVGLVLGPVLGGVLLSQFWWGSVFLVNVPVVVGAVVLGWWAIPESRDPAVARFDPIGVLLSVLGLAGLLWATIQAPIRGWGAAVTLGSFAAGFAVLASFVVWELHCEHPMLELRFFRNLRFSVGNLASAIAGFVVGGALFVFTQLLQSVFGYSTVQAGTHLLPFAVTFVVVGLVSPRLVERIGTKRTVALGLTIFAVGLLILTVTTVEAGYGPVLISMLAIGSAFGLVNAPTTEAVVGAVPREKAGLASGTVTTTRQVGTAFGVAVVGSLLVSGYHSTLSSRTTGIGLSVQDAHNVGTSLGSALSVARQLGSVPGHTLATAARDGFIHGMHLGMAAAAGVAVLAAALALRYLPAHADKVPDASDCVPLDLIVD